ncbi:NAD(P)-binding domain-containing protein [Streptomyces virginiae]|uniref:NAD(P)-binding domain-containing protein n=1 Tax=Streptomyces virginiae TaxID=1961 RepID=UPI003689A81B
MGPAIAGASLAGGHPTTVWNRTVSKADALVSKGAALASTPAEAVEAGELVVVCVLDRDAAQKVLKPVSDQLARRSLSPAEADETSAWAAQRTSRCRFVQSLRSTQGSARAAGHLDVPR